MKLKRCLLLRRECRPLQLHILFFCAANVAHALHHVPSVNHFLRTNPPPVSPRSWQHVVQFSTSTGAGTDDAAVNEDEKARIKAEREARKAAKEAAKAEKKAKKAAEAAAAAALAAEEEARSKIPVSHMALDQAPEVYGNYGTFMSQGKTDRPSSTSRTSLSPRRKFGCEDESTTSARRARNASSSCAKAPSTRCKRWCSRIRRTPKRPNVS